MIRFAVLGCGPAGLLAAHAIKMTGYDVEIISKKEPSKQYGAQWLHEGIPGLSPQEPEAYVKVMHQGDAKTYARKVYGDSRFPTSFGAWGDEGGPPASVPAWDLRRAYADLWDRYQHLVIDRSLDPEEVSAIVGGGTYDYVINSIPRKVLCRSIYVNEDQDVLEKHEFHGQRVWIQPATLPQPDENNFVIYNGDKAPSWYRSSSVFGHGMMEWGDHIPGGKPPVDGVVPVEKPLNTTCSCWTGALIHVGRYGQWRKGVLAHDAFTETIDFIDTVTDPRNEPVATQPSLFGRTV